MLDTSATTPSSTMQANVMPPPAKLIADELENGTEEEFDLNCSKNFEATAISVVVSFPLVLWVCSIVQRIVAQAAQNNACEVLLLQTKPLIEAALALSIILMLSALYFAVSVPMRNWFASLGLLLVMMATYGVLIDFPDQLDEKSLCGIFEASPSSSPMPLGNHNTSTYWNSNIEACVCRTQACEEMVYARYFDSLYTGDTSEFKKVPTQDKPEIRGPSADHMNGTALKNGDESSPGAKPKGQYHKICYTTSSADEGNKTICYECNGCEDKLLKNMQKSWWRLGNKL